MPLFFLFQTDNATAILEGLQKMNPNAIIEMMPEQIFIQQQQESTNQNEAKAVPVLTNQVLANQIAVGNEHVTALQLQGGLIEALIR